MPPPSSIDINKMGFVAFQPKNWIDEDIAIIWLTWILDVLFPGKKVGILLDRQGT